ncbi:signal transducer and activator of transcription 5B-like isoform X2 [Gordionus sp. m RMFG-2023]
MPLTYRLSSSAKYFQELYSDNPLEMVRTIQNCLQMEKSLVVEKDKHLTPSSAYADNPAYKSKFELLHTRTYEADDLLQQIQQEQESFILNNQEGKKLCAQVKHFATSYNIEDNKHSDAQSHMIEYARLKHNKDTLLQALESKSVEIRGKRLHFAEQLLKTQNLLLDFMNTVINEELIKWKINQKLSGSGVPFDDNLNQIQKWFEQISDVAWRNRKQIKRLLSFQNQFAILEHNDMLHNLNSNILKILSSLVYDTFVIEKQPPQVLKTNTRFTASLRLLVGTKLNLHMSTPEVQANIMSEYQAAQILEKKDDATFLPQFNQTSGEILNHIGTMEYDVSADKLCVHFKNMQLKKIKRQEKKGSETVADEKFCIMFKSSFKIAGGEIVFNVWTLSLPIVVIVHGNQEANAWASILWDNAFSDFNREPFKVWAEVPWIKLAEMLNYKFFSMVGKGLSEEDLYYLSTKISGAKYETSPVITIAQFNKEHLQNRPFTFWQWFYHICLIVKEYLRPHWQDNTIIGFVSRNDAHDMLMKKVQYTFLLRFSDSTLGGITIAWLDTNNALGPDKLDVWNLKPFTAKDFSIRSLADRIKDLPHLKILYPDISKNIAFGKYYSISENESNNLKDGYVGTVLVTTTSLPAENKKNNNFVEISSSADSTQKSSPQSTLPMMENEISNPFEDLWNSEAEELLSNFDVDNFNMNFFSNNLMTGLTEEMDSYNNNFKN